MKDGTVSLVRLWDVVLLPLQGEITDAQGDLLCEQVLRQIEMTGPRGLVVDLSGVAWLDSHLCATIAHLAVVDTMTADHIGKLTRAAALLGCRCTITGIGPNIARTLVGIGVDLGEVRTLRTLKDGLRACIELRVARAKRAAAVTAG